MAYKRRRSAKGLRLTDSWIPEDTTDAGQTPNKKTPRRIDEKEEDPETGASMPKPFTNGSRSATFAMQRIFFVRFMKARGNATAT